ncbi:thioredoxin family protein [Desulfobulbus sp. F4]|nr:thioredoxin family protein [Desulfobulbus sp. F4]
MKIRSLSLLTTLFFFSSINTAFALSANIWYTKATGYEEIYEGAKKEQKPFILFFYVDWCGYCKRFKVDLLDNPKVEQFFYPYYRVKINPENGDKENAISIQYGVKGYPDFRVVFPDGSSVEISPFKQRGKVLSADEFIVKVEAALSSKN